jgi:hypothetical protein
VVTLEVKIRLSGSMGCKTNSKGFKESWVGYKLHWHVADGGVPIRHLDLCACA